MITIEDIERNSDRLAEIIGPIAQRSAEHSEHGIRPAEVADIIAAIGAPLPEGWGDVSEQLARISDAAKMSQKRGADQKAFAGRLQEGLARLDHAIGVRRDFPSGIAQTVSISREEIVAGFGSLTELGRKLSANNSHAARAVEEWANAIGETGLKPAGALEVDSAPALSIDLDSAEDFRGFLLNTLNVEPVELNDDNLTRVFSLLQYHADRCMAEMGARGLIQERGGFPVVPMHFPDGVEPPETNLTGSGPQ